MVLLFSVQNVFGGISTFELVLRHSVILVVYFTRKKILFVRFMLDTVVVPFLIPCVYQATVNYLCILRLLQI